MNANHAAATVSRLPAFLLRVLFKLVYCHMDEGKGDLTLTHVGRLIAVQLRETFHVSKACLELKSVRDARYPIGRRVHIVYKSMLYLE